MARSAHARPVLTTVLIADGDGASRAFVAGLLSRLGCVTTEAASGEEALAAARRQAPALVVLDTDLPGSSGYEVCRELRDMFGERLPIVLVSGSRLEPADEVAALLVGADDYIAKPIRDDQFLARARRLLVRSRAQLGVASLTPREYEVLSLLVRGLRPAEIARELSVTAKTTSTHIEHILRKLGAHTQAQAVAFAVRDGMINLAGKRPSN